MLIHPQRNRKMKPIFWIVLLLVLFCWLPLACDEEDDCDCETDCPSTDDDATDDDDSSTDDDDDSADDDFVDPQVEITEPTLLLDPDGSLHGRGWARTPLIQYNPEYIPDYLKWRVKVWDHYTIIAPDFAFAFNIADIQYATFISYELIDFNAGTITSGVDLLLGSHGGIPLTPMETTHYESRHALFDISYNEGVRTLTAQVDKTLLAVPMSCDITLTQPANDENVIAAAPFNEAGYFFLENKTIGMSASGEVTIGGQTYTFHPENSYAVLDWGRGVWPHSHEWHWGFAAGIVDGDIVGINIGDGWSDDSRGTSNIQKYHGKVHKLFHVYFDYDPNNLMQPWEVTSDGDLLRATLTPFYHQKAGIMTSGLGMLIDKMYGTFSGRMTLDDGTIVEFENINGFIEHSFQKW